MKIAVMPGDGIGPEVTAEAVRVLTAGGWQQGGHGAYRSAGGCRRHRRCRRPAARRYIGIARKAEAILFGSVGGPGEEALPFNDRPGSGLLRLRKELSLYANIRPALLFPELIGASTLRPEVIQGLDLIILRELNGDVYFGEPRGIFTDASGERYGINTMRYSESEIERIAHVGFRLARARRGKLCSVDKANVLETMQLWREVVTRVGSEYPGRGAVPSLH